MDRQELLRLIDKAAADQRNVLNLSYNALTKIPEEIGQLQSLTELDLSGNQISKIPEVIGQLQNLTLLNLIDNQIIEIPEVIGQLKSLTELGLSNNQIREIPEVIGELKSLTELGLSNNQIREIPEVIGELKSLTELDLSGNQISKIPEAICQLQNLTLLDLSRNQISKIPEAIVQLQNLTINLSNNQIKCIPQWLPSPPELLWNLDGNPTKSLTEIGVGGFKSFADLTKIKLGFLTILAGTNSSGKSSIMQPLLLMKQTIEAAYDPEILILDGPNVNFTSSEQFISKQSITNNDSKEFQIFIGANPQNSFQSNFCWSVQEGLLQHSQDYILFGKKITLRLDMSPDKIIDAIPNDRLLGISHPEVVREKCFFVVDGGGRYRLNSPTYVNILRSMIHVPGVRGNPERIYKTAATNGNTFTGLFENYVVSVIDRFQKQEPAKLAQLQSHLEKLGLTDTIQTQRLNETQLELRVGRVLGSNETVNIADVGFGVSQVLPVVVALLVAEPKQIVYIEQPEIHLHPRAQVALAEIFAEAINRGVQVIVETHSELFLLGIQTLVAENKIAPQDVQLHWFTRNAVDGSSIVTTAELDETGAFGDWPEDFGSTALALQHRYLSSAEKKLWKSTNNG
jgi:predicted ATPase